MNVLRRIPSFTGIVLLSAAASFAQQVKTDYDRSTDFSRYKTYSWEEVHTENPLWVARIKAAVNSALAAKGYTQVESAGDVSIMAMEMTQSHSTLNTYYDNFGGGWGWRWGAGVGDGFGTSTTTENTYRVGTLVVDLFDSNTKKLIWRGSASDTLSEKSDKNIKSLNKGVEKMFEHFPDKSKGAVLSEARTVLAADASFISPNPAKVRATAEDDSIRPFHINVPEEQLVDLRRRFAATRWPDRETVSDRSQGVQLATTKELVRYWQTDYDGRKAEGS